MRDLLRKCSVADMEFIVRTLECSFNLSDDKGMRRGLEEYEELGTKQAQDALAQAIERELRYAGSADLAYLFRWLFDADNAGVKVNEIITDVAKKLKVKLKPVGTVEAKLERLVKGAFETSFSKLTPEQQRKLLEDAGVGKATIEDIMGKLKVVGPVMVIPLVIKKVGVKAAEKVVTQITVGLIGKFIGTQAAKELVKQMATKFPVWAEWLGPVAWVFTGVWLALDLQSAALRKTAPTLLYLGLVGLRDGPEDGPGFWEDEDNG